MADGKTTIQRIIQVHTNTESVKELKNEITSLANALTNVERGTKEYDDGVKLLQEDQAKLNEITALVRGQNLAVTDSYYSLNKALADARKEYKNMSAAERESAAGRELLGKISHLDEQLKTLDADMGQYQRNVGNYTNSILKALHNTNGPLASLPQGIKQADNAFKILAVNPVIGTITLLATLVMKVAQAMKTSEENANAAAAAFSGFKVIGDLLTKAMQTLGGWLGKVGELLGKWAEKMGLVTDAMRERQEIARQEIELTKAQRDAITQNADAELRIAELRAKAAEKDKYTNKERIAMLQEAADLEAEISKRNYENLKREYENIKATNALTQSSAEDKRKEAEAYAAMVNAQTAYFNKTRELNAQMAAARKSDAADAVQTAEEVKRTWWDETEYLAYIIRAQIELSAKGSDERLALMIEQRRMEYEQERDRLAQSIENEQERAAAIELAEQVMNAEILAMEQELADERQAIRDKENADRLAADERATRERLDAEKKAHDEYIALQKNRVAVVQYSLLAMTSLYEAFGDENAKQSEGYKAIASAQAVIQALLAANEAYASLGSVPLVGPALGAAAAAAALAAGMANVRKINSTNMKQTASTATTTAPAASVTAPAVIQQVGTTRVLTGASEEMAKDTRVYLVYDDVQQAGKRVQIQQSEATF